MNIFSLEKKNLFLFFLISILFSWTLWILRIFVQEGTLYLPQYLINYLQGPFNPAPFGPLLAAFSLTYLRDGIGGVWKLIKRGFSFNFNKIWLVPILLLMPTITGLSLFLSKLIGGTVPELELLTKPWMIIYWFFYMLLLGGPLQEEFGWRGYALDRLQLKYNALKSSIILGFFWAVWHFPLNFLTGVGVQYNLAISSFIVSLILLILLSVLFTWLHNNTKGSVLTALLFHSSLNLSTYKLFPVFESQISALFYLLLVLMSAIVVLVIWGTRRLSRINKLDIK